MHRFYAPDIESTKQLPDDEAQHCVRVLRLPVGSRIEVVDGKGNLFFCELAEAHPKKCVVEILGKETVAPHWGCNVTIAIAPTKNIDRLEWMVEKVTEMGVNRIIPLLCRYSERKVLKSERLRKIAISAMKQSLKAALPKIEELTPITEVVKPGFEGKKFIAYCGEEVERRILSQEYKRGEDVLVLIGPEGDFSKEEVEKALNAGFVPVSLGDSRLRTETAGVFSCAVIHTINQMYNDKDINIVGNE